MSQVFGVKAQLPLEQVWLNTLLEVMKPTAQRGYRRFTMGDVRRLMAEKLDLIPHHKRAWSIRAAVDLMTAKQLWLSQSDGSFVLTAEGLAALELDKN